MDAVQNCVGNFAVVAPPLVTGLVIDRTDNSSGLSPSPARHHRRHLRLGVRSAARAGDWNATCTQ